jgi:hypothetical protein
LQSFKNKCLLIEKQVAAAAQVAPADRACDVADCTNQEDAAPVRIRVLGC